MATATITLYPQVGRTVTLLDGTLITDVGATLDLTKEVADLIRSGELLDRDPLSNPGGPPSVPPTHAARHLLGGDMEIDARRLSLGDFEPPTAGYLPSLNDMVAPFNDVRMLIAHLNGVAEAIYSTALRVINLERLAPYTESGTSRTWQLNDRWRTGLFTSASTVILALPSDATLAFPIGSKLEGYQRGAGQLQFVNGSGATLIVEASRNKTAALNARWQAEKIAANTWILSGSLTT